MIKVKNINESYTALIAQPPQLKLRVANLLKTRVKNYQYDPRFKSGQWDGYKKFYSVKNNYLIYPKVEGNITTALGDKKIIVDGNLTLSQKIIKNLKILGGIKDMVI